MNETKFISHKILKSWGKQCLIASGFSDTDADYVSGSLVQTSLWGIDSHGIARLPHYLNRIEVGSLNPKPNLKVEETGPCTANLNGDHGLGIVVMGEATDKAIGMATKNGIGVIGVRESSHCGAIGFYGREIAEAGLVGIVFTHSDSFVAPHRGYQMFLGTNPICISAPNADGPPVCLDMASSAIAFNYIMNARNENRNIPDSVAYNQLGEPTENPNEVTCLRPMAGHKGYALAFMIDLLCGPLNGMPFGLNIPSMYGDLTKKRHLGSWVMALDPSRFFGSTSFTSAVADMVKDARAQKPKNAKEPVLAPGDDHYANEKERLVTGIPVEAGLLKQMSDWSHKLEINIPA